ncbi:dihydroorotase [Pelagibacterium montanilacus]|uniref:dihydroorotase n=1 Tax=Pelagibacterium montanilacus TaxID=2185280 RepID=UPI000F8D4DCE|nr:dihydroorotase [Pelagibacterium montanilacus]
MRKPLLIENAHIINSMPYHDHIGAILVEDGRVSEIVKGAPPGAPDGAERIDAKGLIASPGLIDMRVFTGEPGLDYRETLESASLAAAAGGVTTIVVMPDTNPVIDDPALVDFVARRAAATAKVRVLPAAAITRGVEGREITEFGLLREAGAVCLTDGRRSIQDSGVLKAAMTYAYNFDMPIVHLPCDASLAAGGQMNAGSFSSFLGLKGIPIEAETIPLDRDMQLALATGVRYHAAPVSTARSIDVLERYRRDGSVTSAGVSINNLCLNQTDIGAYRTYYKLNPPLRTEDDRRALIAGIKSGLIDTIHSDHDPQDSEVKRQPFADAATGAIGLETLLASALRLFHSDDLDIMVLLETMTTRPAQILGLETGSLKKGAPADICLFDVDYPWIVEEAQLRSRSTNTAFENARMTGKVMMTIVGGEIVFKETGRW